MRLPIRAASKCVHDTRGHGSSNSRRLTSPRVLDFILGTPGTRRDMATSFALLALLAASLAVASVHARALPEAVPLVMEMLGGPLMVVRDKREPSRLYPQRTMMFTGFYRPARESAGEQASGVYTQGSSVGGGAYLEQPQFLKDGPEPADEPNISAADAEAAPEPEQPEEAALDDGPVQHSKPQVHAETAETGHQDEQEPQVHQPVPPKKKKRPTPASIPPSDEEEEEEEEEEDESEEENPLAQLAPGKGGRGRQRHPILNNYFPVLFSFPRGGSGTAGSGAAGSPPGLIAAIANSYSTGKGGVASSLATAYGGSPTKKQRRPSSAQ